MTTPGSRQPPAPPDPITSDSHVTHERYEIARVVPGDQTGKASAGREVGTLQAEDSHLFIVRIWNAPGSDGRAWCGRVQHVLRGESHSFSGWPELMSVFEAMLSASDGSHIPHEDEC